VAANQQAIKVDILDNVDIDGATPFVGSQNANFRVSISNDKAGVEVARMRNETHMANTDENMLTENGTVSVVNDKRSNSNAANNSSADEELFLANLENNK